MAAEEPRPLSGAKIGDLVTWHGINGHKFEGYVSQVFGGRAWSPSICDSWHASDCGCHREPWEYDPVDAY